MARWMREIEIEAPPARVWQVMSDVERWPDWTTSMESVEKPDRPLGPGARVAVKPRGVGRSTWTVTSWRPGEGFVWETRVRGSRTLGNHEIMPNGEGRSRARLTVEIPGSFGTLFRPLLSRGIEGNLELEAEGLKRRSEQAG
jgi:uncharacterized membrane protein